MAALARMHPEFSVWIEEGLGSMPSGYVYILGPLPGCPPKAVEVFLSRHDHFLPSRGKGC